MQLCFTSFKASISPCCFSISSFHSGLSFVVSLFNLLFSSFKTFMIACGFSNLLLCSPIFSLKYPNSCCLLFASFCSRVVFFQGILSSFFPQIPASLNLLSSFCWCNSHDTKIIIGKKCRILQKVESIGNISTDPFSHWEYSNSIYFTSSKASFYTITHFLTFFQDCRVIFWFARVSFNQIHGEGNSLNPPKPTTTRIVELPSIPGKPIWRVGL